MKKSAAKLLHHLKQKRLKKQSELSLLEPVPELLAHEFTDIAVAEEESAKVDRELQTLLRLVDDGVI